MASTYTGPPRASNEAAQKWFDETTIVDGPFRELLEKYSHIPHEQVEQHVVQLRNRAWKIHPYPCLGQFRFLELNLSGRGDLYSRLLSITKEGGRFLDIGCCLGQDIRKLIYDGAPDVNVAGAELNEAFIGLGYDLFQDKDKSAAIMVSANIMDPLESSPLAQFKGDTDVVQLGMILHLFTWEESLTVFDNAVRLLKDKKGTMIIGQASGNLEATDNAIGHTATRKTFRHNVESFKKLIGEVGERTGTKWDVTAELDTGLSIYDGKRTWDDPKTRRLLFEVVRI